MTSRRAIFTTAALVSLAAAACVTAPATAPERAATPVSASTGKTWDAVIDVFAERNIPIRNMERASGFIATEPMGVDPREGEKWADCGGTIGVKFGATGATYNVLVRGDSTHATVRATVRWTTSQANDLMKTTTDRECTTRGVWEQDFESLVKSRAEATTAGK